MRPLINFTQKFAEGITEGRLDPNNDAMPSKRSLFAFVEYAAARPPFARGGGLRARQDLNLQPDRYEREDKGRVR
jgi:hypothetical protein